MKTQVYKLDGTAAREIELADAVFNREPSEGSIYHAIRNELANRRVGTASTKTRAEVHGSNKKPWKQKGTGRARAGDRKSPVWVGGGKIFGPKPRDYSYKLPRKVKRLAVASILSLKNQGDALRVVEDFTVASGKTKDLVAAVAEARLGRAHRGRPRRRGRPHPPGGPQPALADVPRVEPARRARPLLRPAPARARGGRGQAERLLAGGADGKEGAA